jgi:hypothetical protein
MIIMEDAVQLVKSREGQLLLPLETVNLDEYRLDDIFNTTLDYYSNKRPIKTSNDIVVTSTGTVIPDCIGVIAVRPVVYQPFRRVISPSARSSFYFNVETRTLSAFPIQNYTYEVIYFRRLIRGNLNVTYQGPFTVATEDTIKFFLKGRFKKGSLLIKKGTLTMSDTTTTGNITTLTGTLGTGTFNTDTLETNLNLVSSGNDYLTISFWTKHTATSDIGTEDIPFMTLFAANLMTAIGSLKKQTVSPEIPFDLSADELLARGRELQDKAEEIMNKNDHWFKALPF